VATVVSVDGGPFPAPFRWTTIFSSSLGDIGVDEVQCLGVEPVVEPGDLVPRWPGGETAGESDSLPAPTGFPALLVPLLLQALS